MSDTQSLRIRDARKDELDVLVAMAARAFKGRPLNEALFPTRLQTDQTSSDELLGREERQYRVQRHVQKFNQKDLHYLVVVDGQDIPVGSAIWQSPLDTRPDEPEANKVEALLGPIAIRPKGMDLAVVAEIDKGLEVLDSALRKALGEDGYKNSWYLDSLAVDPAHQRKGIGKMLMQWGQERADREHRNVRLMASEAGAQLYRAVGYEEVGSLDMYGGTEYAFVKRAI